MAAGDGESLDKIPQLEASNQKPATATGSGRLSGGRKRKRSRGDSLPSERDVKAAAVSHDDEAPQQAAARLAAARDLPDNSTAGALQAIINQARLCPTISGLTYSSPFQAVGPLTSPLAPFPSLDSLTSAPLASSSQRPAPSMPPFISLPLMPLGSTNTDLLTGSLPVQSSSHADLFTKNLPAQASSQINVFGGDSPVESPSYNNLLTRGLSFQSSSRNTVGPSKPLNPPIHVAPSSISDPALSWFSPAEERQKLQAAAAREPCVLAMYECKECGRTFNLPQSLGGHMSRHKQEERLAKLRERKTEADNQEVAESLRELQKASASLDTSGTAECAAGAPSPKDPSITVTEHAVDPVVNSVEQGDQRQQQPSLQALIDSQQQLLLYQQLLQHRLTMLPDGVLVPPPAATAALVSPVSQQHESEVRSRTVVEYDVLRNPQCDDGGGFWNAPEGVRSVAEQQQDKCSSHGTMHTSSTGSRRLEIDLNLVPGDDVEP
ncbi:hypothetical protein CLOM_g16213 [Closterium sp. NIES-68]|nr:hypothetical protein CLOM_g16213 [Closterium sp. NIES-68]